MRAQMLVEIPLTPPAVRAVTEGVDSINHPDVGAAIQRFINIKARHDAVPLESPHADEFLWEPAAKVWEAACGKAISGDILRTLAQRGTGGA